MQTHQQPRVSSGAENVRILCWKDERRDQTSSGARCSKCHPSPDMHAPACAPTSSVRDWCWNTCRPASEQTCASVNMLLCMFDYNAIHVWCNRQPAAQFFTHRKNPHSINNGALIRMNHHMEHELLKVLGIQTTLMPTLMLITYYFCSSFASCGCLNKAQPSVLINAEPVSFSEYYLPILMLSCTLRLC